jgi:NNP family nitrate/nitrite transporter-like MFS transporter
VLVFSTIAFTVFFAVWVMFSIVGLPLRAELGLSDGQFALLAAIPILTGSVLRVPVGMLTDKLGGRVMMTSLLVLMSVPSYLVSQADSYEELLVLAFVLGLAGTSFAIGIPWVSAWYPSQHQGTALGVFGMGNVGASITKMLAPALVTVVAAGGALGGFVPGGWRFVPFAYAILLLVTALVVWIGVPRQDRRPARGRTLRAMSRPLVYVRVWRFGFYYVVVFGAYVALALWLPKYYVDVYDMSLAQAGMLTALFIFPASLLRPLGGWLSDRIGARRVTAASFLIIGGASLALSFPTDVLAFTLLVLAIGVGMGVGKASVFTYIPQYFPRDVGAVGGLVGAVGGLGGFVLPLLFAWALAETGRPQSTFQVMFALAVASLLMLGVAVLHIITDHDHHGEM